MWPTLPHPRDRHLVRLLCTDQTTGQQLASPRADGIAVGMARQPLLRLTDGQFGPAIDEGHRAIRQTPQPFEVPRGEDLTPHSIGYQHVREEIDVRLRVAHEEHPPGVDRRLP
jgi:hypothetical protein